MKSFKKLACVLAATFALSAQAAGPYDGIYKHPNDANGYWSIHTNGAALIVTSYTTIPATGIVFYTIIGSFQPTRADNWDLLIGSINGDSGSVTGEILYGACNASYTVRFGPTSLTATAVSASPTQLGSSKGMNCSALNAYSGSQIVMPRVF